ncbi:MAG: signal peptide peptidase SppA [Prevotella sp.]|nr:signal peptide peptidase SppA [Prevotella sp.]
MKDFFKYVLATMVGLLAFGLLMAILGVMSLVGMVASGSATQNVSDNTVLVMNLAGQMEEQAGEDVMGLLMGSGINGMGLQETLSAIEKAKENDKVKGIYIEAGAFGADYAQVQEIRDALKDFKKSGKWIVAYGDSYSQGAYYLCSVADKVYLNPSGEVDWHGIASEPMFVKDLLQKVGVKMQVVKVGKYKSATEMYTEDRMSDANREQVTAFITGIWNNMVKAVGESRKISSDSLNAYADRLVMFEGAEALKKMKFVDELLYHDQVKAEVKKLLDIDEDKKINQVSIGAMQNVKQKQKGEQIAVYYAYGDIVDTPSQGLLMGGGHQIVGNEVNKDLQKLAEDEDVKAVVIRVNSPGGSAYASEQIWHQIEELKAKKPVVVSMGGYAASGGYYISCGANYIFAEPTTLTGSIGIFGVLPDRSELMTKKLGLKFDEVKTNKNANFGASSRPFNAEELGLLQGYINRGYELFRKRVADGRKMTVEQIEENAQGHVFTGEDALKIKLVDELGGLDKAVAKAAKLAKLDEYHTTPYPASPDLMEQLLNKTNSGSGNYLDEQLRLTLGEYYKPFVLLREANSMSTVQARMPFFLNLR